MKTIYRMRTLVAALSLVGVGACRIGNVLKVPIPAGVISNGDLSNQAGAEAVFATGKSGLYSALYGNGSLVQWSEQLTDEFTWAAFTQTYTASSANVDARMTVGTGYPGYSESGDYPWESVLQARTELAEAMPGLKKYEPATGVANVGEAYALTAYAELFIAESYCGGTPLSEILPTGGYQYGMPLTDDSLFVLAQMNFDSALAYVGSPANETIVGLASVGLGRALLDRGQIDSAAAAVQNVPASFVYNANLPASYSTGYYSLSLWAGNIQYPQAAQFNVADTKGENGLNFISANDPRLTFNSTSYLTFDGGAWYLPNKFSANFSYIPMATGIEAALIQAEAALSDGNTATWLADLNALRNSNAGGCADLTNAACTLGSGQVPGQTTGVYSLADPGTDTGRVSLMFRERAFWLYGTGSRLGDLRRLMRAPYSRDSSLVFPHGPYPNGSNANLPSPIPTYGTDVNLTIPSKALIAKGQFTESNPNYKGCITSTTTP